MTSNLRHERALLRSLLVLTVAALPQAALCQYGDAYHKPDFGRLQQMQRQREAQVVNEHRASISRSNSNSSSQSGGNTGSGNTSSGSGGNTWADTSRIDAQRAAGARNQAIVNTHEAKMRKLEVLLAERRLQRRPEDHAGIYQAALDAGLDDYIAYRFFGRTPAEYAAKLGVPYTAPLQGTHTQTGGSGTSRFTRTGNWTNGRATGAHTWRYENGLVVVANFDRPELGSIQWTNDVRFTGEVNGTKPVKGKTVYASGATFEGVFDSDGRPYLGTWIDGEQTFTGERRAGLRHRGTLETPTLRFEGVFDDKGFPQAGQLTRKGDGSVSTGFFGDKLVRQGYVVDQQTDGSANEQLFERNESTGPVIRTRANGDVVTGMSNVPGFQLVGIYQARDGKRAAVGLSAEGTYTELPPERQDEGRRLAEQAAAVLLPERLRLRALIEQR